MSGTLNVDDSAAGAVGLRSGWDFLFPRSRLSPSYDRAIEAKYIVVELVASLCQLMLPRNGRYRVPVSSANVRVMPIDWDPVLSSI